MDVKEFTDSLVWPPAMWSLVVGKRLGSGCFRDVFACKLNDAWVIKFQREAGDFDNIKEWEAWSEYQHEKDVAKWLAPCRFISASGDILIQDKTSFIKKLPDKIPSFLTDVKSTNFGEIKGHLVCHDYGFLLNSKLRKGLKKANWRV